MILDSPISPNLRSSAYAAVRMLPSLLLRTIPAFLTLWFASNFTLFLPQNLLLPLSGILGVLLYGGFLVLIHLLDVFGTRAALSGKYLAFLRQLPIRAWLLLVSLSLFTLVYSHITMPSTVAKPILRNLLLPNSLASAAELAILPVLALVAWTLLFAEGVERNGKVLDNPLRATFSREVFPLTWRLSLPAIPVTWLALLVQTQWWGVFPQLGVWMLYLWLTAVQYFLVKSIVRG